MRTSFIIIHSKETFCNFVQNVKLFNFHILEISLLKRTYVRMNGKPLQLHNLIELDFKCLVEVAHFVMSLLQEEQYKMDRYAQIFGQLF